MSYLRHLSTHTTRELHVFDKDGDALAVNRLQIRVFKQMRQIRLAGLNRLPTDRSASIDCQRNSRRVNQAGLIRLRLEQELDGRPRLREALHA